MKITNPVYTILAWVDPKTNTPKMYVLAHADAECVRIAGNATLPADQAEAMQPWPCPECVTVEPAHDHPLVNGLSLDAPTGQGTGSSKGKAATARAHRDVKVDKVERVTDDDFVKLVNERFLDRKFEVSDLTPELHAYAEWWAREYQGTFEFVVDMRANMVNFGRLTPGQAKGTLNCARADVIRARQQIEQTTAKVEDGFYMTADGQQVFKIQWNQTHTHLYGKALDEDTGTFEYDKSVLGRVTRGLADGTVVPLTAERASAYGHLYGRCMICSRRLTDEASIEAGIGPVCAAKL